MALKPLILEMGTESIYMGKTLLRQLEELFGTPCIKAA